MATKVQIDPGSPQERTAKIRHPVAVPVLSVITLGIYGIYWWYQINREMVDLGKTRNAVGLGENATNSLLAVFPGFLLIVPPYFSLYNGVKRMQRAQEVTRGDISLNGWIVLALILASYVTGIAGLIVPGYIQSEMNKVWETLEPGGGGGVVPETPATAVTPQEPPAPAAPQE
ncbi:MAG TPA: DUF4234 domain-containing protein [Solirubrobacterales bacterium]|nr:DUF4234 domain-containing protein [Solirubrobacterales bacterium]